MLGIVRSASTLVWCLAATVLTACATDRTTLQPPTTPVRTVPAASRPMAAHDLAGRMGMSYADQGDHVVLSDTSTRVRIWSNSDLVSVGGERRKMRGRTHRQGRALVMPAPMATYVQREVSLRRSRIVALRSAPTRTAPTHREPVRTARRPARPAPTPAPEPPPAEPPPRLEVPSGWAPPATAAARPWRWIVLHHSDDTSGNLAKYDRLHRVENGWDECGYHFVIGNGTLSRDGEVEVGSRWVKQKHGAHCKTDDNCFNDYGIGICLVGDFETGGRPTPAQMDSLARLCRWLMTTYDVSPSDLVGHCDCKPTACPGRYFPWEDLRRRLAYAAP
ncbi:MAG: peptidoglycan recognition protein family protein [Planctomycetota bacterium]|jgi:hypothetical protein